jgi:hypothetical protein
MNKRELFGLIPWIVAWELFALVQVAALSICFPFLLPAFEDFYKGRPLPLPTIFACENAVFLWWVLLLPIIGWLLSYLSQKKLWLWIGIGIGTFVLWGAFWLSFVALIFPFARWGC